MATANDLILAAYRRGRIIGIDQVMSAARAALGLAAMNRMLDVWWNDRLAVFRILQESFALVAGQVSRTIGATGNFVTTRPLNLADGCFVRRDGIDYELTVLKDRTLYDGIAAKSGASGIPRWVFYDQTVPNGTLYFYPVPDAADTVYLNSPSRLQSVAALVTPIVLPPGYEDFIVDGLAIKLASDNGLEATPSVKKSFATTQRSIKKTNAPTIVMSVDPALLPVRPVYNIVTDQ